MKFLTTLSMAMNLLASTAIAKPHDGSDMFAHTPTCLVINCPWEKRGLHPSGGNATLGRRALYEMPDNLRYLEWKMMRNMGKYAVEQDVGAQDVEEEKAE